MALELLAAHLGASRCLGCARPGSMACTACLGAMVAGTERRPVPHIDRVVAAWEYDGVARSLILALKLRRRREAARPLADGIAGRVLSEGFDVDALVWVPGRRADIRRRGYDHAKTIAGELSRLLGIPAMPALRRTGDRIDQTGLGAAQRRANLKGAFIALPVPERVGVVDDVVTTGATLSEAGRALRAAGAGRVEATVGCVVR